MISIKSADITYQHYITYLLKQCKNPQNKRITPFPYAFKSVIVKGHGFAPC